MRVLIVFLIALSTVACAKKDTTVESVSGTEPQRLSFGPPPEVMATFVEKMKVCWFNSSKGHLNGYRYETGERPASEGASGSSTGYQNIKIYAAGGATELFEIQFHKYNENTLIVTRNVSMQNDLTSKLKRDIQLWALVGNECSSA